MKIIAYKCISRHFQGLGPTAQRGMYGDMLQFVAFALKLFLTWLILFPAAVIAAVELPVYDFCKLHLLDTFGDHVANHFM